MTTELCLDVEVLKQHMMFLGKTGAGKSSALRHIIEYKLERKDRVCIIDPKGDWWGLKVAGKIPGFQVIAFGDFKDEHASDVPINEFSGKEVANLILNGNRPAIIGLRGWMPAAQARFWIDFASTVFNSNKCGGLTIVLDEVQNFAPKELVGFGKGENMALHWTKRLLSEGRGLGLTIFAGSQRPQAVHNGVLTQCETLVAMKLIHDADCTAVESWLKRTRDKAVKAEIMTTIPELVRGEGWVWCPEVGFGPKRVKFPMFHTFDSFAPPQLQKKISANGWANVDLDEVKEQLKVVIEEVKGNDPKLLRAEIVKLKADLARKVEPTPPLPPEKVSVLTEGDTKRLETLIADIELTRSELDPLAARIEGLHGEVVYFRNAIAAANGVKGRSFTAGSGFKAISFMRSSEEEATKVLKALPLTPAAPGITPVMERVLTAIAEMELLGVSKPDRKLVALLAGYENLKSDGFVKASGNLRSLGLAEYPDPDSIAFTEKGRSAAKFPAVPQSSEEVQDRVCKMLGGKCEEILRVLINAFPEAVDRQTVAAAAGYQNVKSDGFVKVIGKLRVLGFAEYPSSGTIRATSLLFLQ